MNSANEIAMDLLKRLLGGERGEVPMHLAMLLEKSSSLADSNENYRQILPPALADLMLSPETRDEIVRTLCAEISRNPDADLILAASYTAAELVTKTVADVLASPPRPLTMAEYANGLSLMSEYLADKLSENPQFLPKGELKRLIALAQELRNVEPVGAASEDPSIRFRVRHHAAGFLDRLAELRVLEE